MFFLPDAYYVVCLLFVSSVFAFVCFFVFLCLCFFVFFVGVFCLLSSVILPGDDVFCWLVSCPFASVCFLCFFFFGRVSGLIWFVSVDLVTTAGFVADQLITADHAS